jgi:hypothetical protein
MSYELIAQLTGLVGSLNFLAAGWGCHMISAFPAPLVWTPSLFFGVVWCAAVALTMTVLSLILTASLSEHRDAAGQRDLE